MPSKPQPKPKQPRPQGDGSDKFGNRGWKPPKPNPNTGEVKPPGGPGGSSDKK